MSSKDIDHELQRTYGAVAAYLSGAYYLKLTGEKYSEKDFGGAKYNPFSTPKIFIDEVGYEGYIIANWETEEDNKFTLQRNADYPSCPPDIAILTATLQNAVSAFVSSEKDWFNRGLAVLKQDKSYQTYRKQVDAATGANGICLKWDKRKLVNSTSKNFLPAFSAYFGFSNYTKPTPIIEVANEVDEGEVTYTIVHKVLIPNGFQIVSVSYPGSQGGGAVLPNPELGKAQPREYPDVIALPPANSTIDVVLNESKGMFSKSSVEKDLEKILRYKTDPKLITALKETLFVAQVIDKHKQLKNIVIGVAFGVKNNTSTNWQPNNVDFIFRITNRNQWAIGIFKQEMRDLITMIEGKTNFPMVYKLSKEKEMKLKFEE